MGRRERRGSSGGRQRDCELRFGICSLGETLSTSAPLLALGILLRPPLNARVILRHWYSSVSQNSQTSLRLRELPDAGEPRQWGCAEWN